MGENSQVGRKTGERVGGGASRVKTWEEGSLGSGQEGHSEDSRAVESIAVQKC